MKKLLLLLLVATSFGATALAQTNCQAYFFANTNGCPQILFNDYSAADSMSGDFVTSWNWTFGDGGTSTAMNPTYTYSSNGMYVVCLSISTNAGCQSTYCETIAINCLGGGGGNCQAMFYQDSSICPTISLISASTSTNGIASYYYDFGDGSTSSMMNPTHTYAANGNYQVCLTITALDSCTSTYCETININCLGGGGNCQAAFYQDSAANCPTINLYSASTSNSGIMSYYYDFGDGSTSGSMNSTHTYTANGNYTVCLTIVAQDSCTDTYCETVTINCISGLEEAKLNNSFVSPNPAQNQLTLHLEQAHEIHYRIIGMNGQVYAEGDRTADTKHQFELEALSQGMYFLDIEAQGAREVLRFTRK